MGRHLKHTALLAVVVSGLSGTAHAEVMKVKQVVPVSGKTPFHSCPFDAPPPFTNNEWQPADTAVEPHLAIDPNQPQRMATAWMQDFAGSIVVASTTDGGKTWRRSIPPHLSKCTGTDTGTSADPRLAYGADGTLYLSSMRRIVLNPARTTPNNEVAVSVSPDGGATWRNPVVIQSGDAYNDWPYVATDPEDPRRVYVTFTRATEPFGNGLFTMFASSEDGGRTFSEPRAIFRSTGSAVYYSAGHLHARRGGRLMILLWVLDGINYMPIIPVEIPQRLIALTSSDRGQTWGETLAGEQSPTYNAVDPETGEPHRAGMPHVSPAPDGGYYIAYQDFDSERRSRMMFVRGRPDGTWEPPRQVLPWGERQILFPTIAATAHNTLGVTWYDTRNDRPDDGKFLADAFFAYSRDGGATFKQSHIAGPMDLRGAWRDARDASGSGQAFLGDYIGMAAHPRGFVAALPLTKPVSEMGKSQLFVASMGTPATKRAAKKRAGKSKKKKAEAKRKQKKRKTARKRRKR